MIDRFTRDDSDLMLTLELPEVLGRRAKVHALPGLVMVLVVSAKHPLAGLESVSPDVVREYTDIVVRDSSPRHQRAPPPTFLGSRHVVRVSDFHTKLLAIHQGVGFGWMPEHLAREALASGTIVSVKFTQGNRWTYAPHLVERAQEPMGRAGQFLVRLLLADAGDLPFGSVQPP